jgi:aminobenzoyl-glutamate utilization protein B
MDAKQLKSLISEYTDAHRAEFFELEHKVWEVPELALNEHKSSAYHVEFLKARGFDVLEKAAGMDTAYVATKGSGSPVIGFSAEFDALPGLSQKVKTTKDPIIPEGPGHGCGHNLLGVGSVLAACALAYALEKTGTPGTVKVFGAPAEELCIGKPLMGNAGLFNGTDAVFDWHPMATNYACPSTCPAYFSIKYHFKGRTAHGNSPWYGRSALDAAMLMAHGIEMLREHIPPAPGGSGVSHSAAHTINYTFSDTGPEFASVVPDHAVLWCVGRMSTSELMSDVIRRIGLCADGAAMATETTVEPEYIAASHEMLPNEALARVVNDNLLEIGAPDYTAEERAFIAELQKNEGQEPYWDNNIQPFTLRPGPVVDSSEYTWVCPYNMLIINLGPGPGWHNWMVTACSGSTLGEKAMEKAGRIMAASAADVIANPKVLEEAKAEWAEHMKGREYKSLI